MERYDLYDNNRLPLGKTLTRGEDPAHGENRMVVHLCVFNTKGEMLIQQRVSSKKLFPSLWDITLGGCSIAGETSQESVHREMLEEIGIDHDFSNTRPHFTINFHRGFDDWYLIHLDLDETTLTLQKEEVQGVMWASVDKIVDLLNNNQFIPYKESFIRALFDFKNGRGLY